MEAAMMWSRCGRLSDFFPPSSNQAALRAIHRAASIAIQRGKLASAGVSVEERKDENGFPPIRAVALSRGPEALLIS